MIRLLFNTIGDDAASIAYSTSAVATGYDGNDAISGPRNRRVRGIKQTLAGSGYANPFSVRYTGSGCSGIDHVVVTDFDLNIPDPAANGFDLQYNDGSWHTLRNEAPLSTTLRGKNGTDLVYEFSPVTVAGTYIFYFSSWVQRPYTDRATEFGKVYFSKGFDFGENPELGKRPMWEMLPASQPNYFTPLRSSLTYEVEASITLSWSGITRAKLQEFKAQPQLLNWPLFLYDSTADLWDWKLEHVVIDTWAERTLSDDCHEIQIRFHRLKHYR